MLSIYGNSSGRFCDGVSRRNFLKIGGLGMGGLALPQLLRASAASGGGSHERSIAFSSRVGPSSEVAACSAALHVGGCGS